MNSMPIRLVAAVCFASLASCATQRTSQLDGELGGPDGEESEQFSRQGFDEISRCAGAWNELLVEWKMSGGGLKPSVLSMRQQIDSDVKSRFSAIVRATWEIQRHDATTPGRALGDWPVSREEKLGLSDAFASTPHPQIPAGCYSTAWLLPMLWDAVIVQEDGSVGQKPEEAPTNMIWESPTAGSWLMHWLLRRLP